jgi:hypothetical protein
MSAKGKRNRALSILMAILKSILSSPDWERIGSHFLRGATLISEEEIDYILANYRHPRDPGFLLGRHRLPWFLARLGTLFLGDKNAGKSLSAQLAMASTLPWIGRGRVDNTGDFVGQDNRAVILDVKQEHLPLLAGMPLSAPVISLNPSDIRSFAVDVAADWDPAIADTWTAALIPIRENEAQSFFLKAVRQIVGAVPSTFHRLAPGNWIWADIINACRSRKRLIPVIKLHPEAPLLLEFLRVEPTATNIMQTLATETRPLAPIAACWQRARGKISLTRFMTDEAILVLTFDYRRLETSLLALRIIFARLSQLVRALPPSFFRTIHFFLDESREAADIIRDYLPSLQTTGRDRGVCPWVVVQDVEGFESGIRDKGLAQEILGMCSLKCFHRAPSEYTAEWMSKQTGEEDVIEYPVNESVSKNGTSTGVGQHHTRRPLILPSEFMRIRPATRRDGFHAVHSIAGYAAYWTHLTPDFLSQNLSRSRRDVSGFIERPSSHFEVEDWTRADLERLHLPSDILALDRDEDDKPPPRIVR